MTHSHECLSLLFVGNMFRFQGINLKSIIVLRMESWMGYDHFEHCHRFAVWACARATQRGFTSVRNLKFALESTNLKTFLQDPISLNTDSQSFGKLHRSWCKQIIRFLANRNVKGSTFGRAAKLVAVYLKVMVVIGAHSGSKLAHVIHPPIDRILLKNLSKEDPQMRSLLAETKWTQLNESKYYSLISKLQVFHSEREPWWKLEQYWTVVN